MQQRFNVDLDAPPERVFPLVADLAHYEQLLDIVHRVTPDRDLPEDGSQAWSVTLRAELGPLARSKRLRMERTVHEPLSVVRFERTEQDGRDHSLWVLEAAVRATDEGSQVTMMLDYGGRLWSGVLDGVLEAQVASAGRNLQLLAAKS